MDVASSGTAAVVVRVVRVVTCRRVDGRGVRRPVVACRAVEQDVFVLGAAERVVLA